MPLDDLQMPSFQDPDGTTYIWDPGSKSYVKAPLTDKRPDIGHATGGDNDLFDPFQHSEKAGVPELEGYMAKVDHECGTCGGHFDPYENDYTCPQCGTLISLEEKEPSIEDFEPVYDEPWPELLGLPKHQGAEWATRPVLPEEEMTCPFCDMALQDGVCPRCGRTSEELHWTKLEPPGERSAALFDKSDFQSMPGLSEEVAQIGLMEQHWWHYYHDKAIQNGQDQAEAVRLADQEVASLQSGHPDKEERARYIQTWLRNFGVVAKLAFVDEPPFPSDNEVKCPNCGETTAEKACETCGKDLTPEWNVKGQGNEFFGVHPEFNDSKEWRTWPQNVPQPNMRNYDDSFPSMSLSKRLDPNQLGLINESFGDPIQSLDQIKPGDLLYSNSLTHQGKPNVMRVVEIQDVPSPGFTWQYVNLGDPAQPRMQSDQINFTWADDIPEAGYRRADDLTESPLAPKTAADVFDLLDSFQQKIMNERPAWALGRATAVAAFDPETRAEAEQVYNAWNVNPQFTEAWNDALNWAGHPQMPPETKEMYLQEFRQLRQSLGSTKTAASDYCHKCGSYNIYIDPVNEVLSQSRCLDCGATWQSTSVTSEQFNEEMKRKGLPFWLGSKTAEALTDGWDEMFAGDAPMRAEVGKWILDKQGQMHIDHGMHTYHEYIQQRDGLNPTDVIALGAVYNNGTADVQKLLNPQWFDLNEAQQLLEQVFGGVVLSPPIGLQDRQNQIFPPEDIQGGQWFIPPHTGTITGSVWVKDKPEGVQYQPDMILVAEHLETDDFATWSLGSAAIITAVGGAGSHAAYLAMTENIPVIVGIGDSYNKLQTGNHVKIEPTSETITVMPGATSATESGGSVSQPTFSHFHEELAWKEAHEANLEECPECRAPMFDRDGESQCGDCGHKQRVIQAGVAALPIAAEALGGGEAAAAGGAAGGGMGGIGGLMTKAMRPGFGMGMAVGRGGGGGDSGGGGAAAGPAPTPFDPNAGTVARTSMQHQAILSELWGLIQNALQAVKGGASAINWDAVGSAAAANPLDDAAIGGLAAVNQHLQNQYQQVTSSATTFAEEEVGVANKNRGTNSTDEASNSGTEGKDEQGDGPEQLKDVDGAHDSQGSSTEDAMAEAGDPHMQDKALKAFHMNLPLVIEFAQSDEAGADNPILMALDQLLEDAFPGYKDGTDEEAGSTTEHPQESETPEERDEDTDKPDPKSEGSDKEARKIASTFHFAWGDEPGRGYNDGMEMDPDAYGGPRIYVQCPNCQHGETYADFEKAELDGRDPYTCPQCGEEMVGADSLNDAMHEPDDDQAYGEYEQYGPDRPTMQDHFPHEARILKEGVWHFAIQGGEPSAWAVRDSLQAPTQWGQQQPQQQPQQPQLPAQPLQGGQPEAYSCMNCGEQHEFPSNTNPRDLPACPQCGERSWTHSGLPQTYASLDPSQPAMGGTPAGAGGPAMQICPRCGQAHTAGVPCPVADVTTPLTTGDPTSMAGGSNKVITKWHLANPSLPASQPQMAAGAPAAPSTCPTCGCNHIPGTPCPTEGKQPMQQPGAGGGNLVQPSVGPGVAYSAFEDHLKDLPEVTSDDNPEAESPMLDDDHGDYHSEDDWTDTSGSPLEEGAEYELKTAHSPIPDRVTIEHILPEKLTYLIHSGDVDYRDTITRDQLELDGTEFAPVDFDDTGEDSMDSFSQEMPPRPGDDALPQQDDLSVPSTVMGAFEPVSLDTYTGSYEGDAPDDRSWLMGDSSEVAVDPALMAKLAAKDYSPREQREFIEEKGTARNLDRLDLEGTHYIDDELGTADSLW